MLDKKRHEVIKFHMQLSKTLKELKSLLPSGFMKKTHIYSPKVIPIKHNNNTLNNTKNNIKDSKDMNETDFNKTNKNINIENNSLGYALSEGNKSPKKLITKLTSYFHFPFNKYKNKVKTAKYNDNNKINFVDNYYMNKIKKKKIRMPKLKKTFKNFNELNENYKTNSMINLYSNDIRFIHPLITIRKNYKGSLIDNSMLKANICLPTLTERLKSKLPRCEREKYGFILKNYKNDYFNRKEDTEKELRMKKYKLINVNKYYFKENKMKKDKKIQLSNSFFKQMKMNESVEIKSVKKIKPQF